MGLSENEPAAWSAMLKFAGSPSKQKWQSVAKAIAWSAEVAGASAIDLQVSKTGEIRMQLQTSFLALIAACLAAGCTTMPAGSRESGSKEPVKAVRSMEVEYPNGFDSKLFTAPDRKNARVYVDEDGLLVVDQEPLRRKANDTYALTWRLDMSSPYVFPDDGAIALIGTLFNPLPADLSCGIYGVRRKVFQCTYTRTGPALWKYSVKVINENTSAALTTLDPSVHQQ
jgi:hypothetical protein